MITSGRDNLALTIMVPYDCKNNCKFCTSKKLYAERKPRVEAVLASTDEFFRQSPLSSMVKEVVITGGEPMSDIYTLDKILKLIPSGRKVFINTTFIKKNLSEFVFFVNTNPKIAGVNISRHTDSYANDCKIMSNIAEDSEILKFKKPVRINCVIGNKSDIIDRVVARWSSYKLPFLEVSFRANYNEVTEDSLHDPYASVPMYLATSGWKYITHTQCNVCDTILFENEDHFVIRYHRGVASTLIKGKKDNYEVNDIIISHDGRLYLDWELTEANLADTVIKKVKTGSYLANSDWGLPNGTLVNHCGSPRATYSSCGRSSYTSCGGGGHC